MSNNIDKIDWKRKLTSRKFWLAVIALVFGIYVFITHDEETGKQIAALIMDAAVVVSYIIGEGLADGMNKEDKS